MISGVVDRHHEPVSCCPYACLEHTPFEMLIQSITCWGYSLHVPSLLWEHLHSDEVNVIVVVRVVGVQPTDEFRCHFFQPWRCLEWSVDDSCKFLHKGWHFVYQLAAVSLTLELERRRTVWSGEGMEEGHSFTRCCAKVWGDTIFREIILVVFPALKEIQISAAGFRALIWWKLLKRMTTTSVSPVWTIPSDDVRSACKRCIRTRVSASSWLHCSIGWLFPTWRTSSPAVMYTSFSSGNFSSNISFQTGMRTVPSCYQR